MWNFLWLRPQGLGTFWNMKKTYQCFEVDFHVTLLATIWNMWKGIPFCKFSYNYGLTAHNYGLNAHYSLFKALKL